jgi:hypothetical protein
MGGPLLWVCLVTKEPFSPERYDSGPRGGSLNRNLAEHDVVAGPNSVALRSSMLETLPSWSLSDPLQLVKPPRDLLQHLVVHCHGPLWGRLGWYRRRVGWSKVQRCDGVSMQLAPDCSKPDGHCPTFGPAAGARSLAGAQ